MGLGPGRLRRRLRQRRPRGPVRHVLRPEPLVPQRRRRTVRRRHRARPVSTQSRRAGVPGCAFLDYDRDGKLDLFVANYIDLDLATAPTPDSGLCRYKGVPVACGPPGLKGGKNALYHNRGDGRFEDVSEASGITQANGTYGLGVSTLDFDDDGWTDFYVANDSNPSALYRNRHDGTFEDIGVTRRLRVQPGRQAAGGHGRGHRRLRPQRHDGHPEDELRRRHVDAVRQPRRRLLRGPDVRRRPRPEHAMARLGRRVRGFRQRRLARHLPRPTATSIPKCGSCAPRPATSSARSSTATSRRPVRGRQRAARAARDHAEGRPRDRLRRHRQQRHGGRRHQQRARHARPVPDIGRRQQPLADAPARRHAGRTGARSARA